MAIGFRTLMFYNNVMQIQTCPPKFISSSQLNDEEYSLNSQHDIISC